MSGHKFFSECKLSLLGIKRVSTHSFLVTFRFSLQFEKKHAILKSHRNCTFYMKVSLVNNFIWSFYRILSHLQLPYLTLLPDIPDVRTGCRGNPGPPADGGTCSAAGWAGWSPGWWCLRARPRSRSGPHVPCTHWNPQSLPPAWWPSGRRTSWRWTPSQALRCHTGGRQDLSVCLRPTSPSPDWLTDWVGGRKLPFMGVKWRETDPHLTSNTHLNQIEITHGKPHDHLTYVFHDLVMRFIRVSIFSLTQPSCDDDLDHFSDLINFLQKI